MPGATDTTNGPDVALEGMVMLIDVLLHEFTITGVPFRFTTLLPCEAPKLAPVMTTVLPIVPVVAVASDEVLPLFTTKPTYTFGVMLTVWFPTSVQFTPSGEA